MSLSTAQLNGLEFIKDSKHQLSTNEISFKSISFRTLEELDSECLCRIN